MLHVVGIFLQVSDEEREIIQKPLFLLRKKKEMFLQELTHICS